MRVGLLSYPTLFQRDGGLQVQLRATLAALHALADPALEATLADPQRQPLCDYDVLHVFSAINGNYRLLELAAEIGVPVVLSALVSPAWSRCAGVRARLAGRMVGRLTGWQVHTSYAETRRALELANLVVALGEAERRAIVSAYGIAPDKLRVLPNGVERRFFEATPALFAAHTGISGPFVLMAGAISPYKNQLALAQALAYDGVRVVLVGCAASQHEAYLQQLLRLPNVRWLGYLAHDDRLLASAYAAAAALALPSQGEVFPLVVLEALAAGTPAVMTDASALQLADSDFALRALPPHALRAWRSVIAQLLRQPPARAAVSALVTRFAWPTVAQELAHCYRAVHRAAVAPGAAAGPHGGRVAR